MEKTWRIALASLDGKFINEHFGRAEQFYIIDISADGDYQLAELRSVEPFCTGGEHPAERMEARIKALSDCAAIVVSQIGPAARRALELNRIAVFEQPDYIDDAIPKLAKYFVKTNFTKPEENKR